MNASDESFTQEGRDKWLLLLHQLPPKPDYFRVKVRRRLQRLGAVPLKNSVYVLPRSDATLEDFQWLLGEIVSDGGEATICSAGMVAGISDSDLEALFCAERQADYDEVARTADAVDASNAGAAADVARLKRKLEAIVAVDFFGADARRQAEEAISALEHRLQALDEPEQVAPVTAKPRGATWVTRKGVFIDRIASAWLIRRFIDPLAVFRFVSDHPYRKKPGELRFDMYGGEFTHAGNRCTFETLVAQFEPDDAALHAIGEMVHDIDLKDDKFGREETAGIAAVIQGMALATADDEERLGRGAMIFDGLYGRLKRG
jgi:hypothetical protein